MAASGKGSRLFLGGDAMTGRGIDQALANPCDPVLYELAVTDARDYLHLAERASGPIARPLAPDAIWGEALPVLSDFAPDARIANLETAITDHAVPWPGKGINYRMHPANADCLGAVGLDCCVLANNHVLDWERQGLADTRASLRRLGIATCGAGEDVREATAPAILNAHWGRILVFAYGHASSGIPREWQATAAQSGINLLADFSDDTVAAIARHIAAWRQPGDRVMASLHWGGNWGWAVPAEHQRFARALIDDAGIDLVHGHSSHHPRPLEVYRGRLILYGCGDWINDYEGIGGHGEYRPDLVAMYFPRLHPDSGLLDCLDIVPMRLRRLRLERATAADARWLANTLNREGADQGTRLVIAADGTLRASAT